MASFRACFAFVFYLESLPGLCQDYSGDYSFDYNYGGNYSFDDYSFDYYDFGNYGDYDDQESTQRAHFAHMDLNGDGVVTFTEVETAFGYEAPSEDDFNEYLDLVGGDVNVGYTVDDFLSLVALGVYEPDSYGGDYSFDYYDFGNYGDYYYNQESTEINQKLRAHFAQMDVNGDGVVTFTEVETAFGYEAPSEDDFNEYLDRVGGDVNVGYTVDDFLSLMNLGRYEAVYYEYSDYGGDYSFDYYYGGDYSFDYNNGGDYSFDDYSFDYYDFGNYGDYYDQESTMRAHFAHMDLNGDGVVTFTEVETAFGYEAPSEDDFNEYLDLVGGDVNVGYTVDDFLSLSVYEPDSYGGDYSFDYNYGGDYSFDYYDFGNTTTSATRPGSLVWLATAPVKVPGNIWRSY